MHGEGILLANMSGSLGGSVFYTSKGKQVVRTRVSPIQPNTVAQVRAKSAFAAAGANYRGILGSLKTEWNNFAKTIFSPKNKANQGQFSGQQAFQAVSVSFNNSVGINQPYLFKVNGSLLPSGDSRLPFLGSPSSPPIKQSSASLLATAGEIAPLTFNQVSVDASGQIIAGFQVGNGLANDLPGIFNTSGVNVGFAFYLSSSNPTTGMNYRNIEKYLLGYFNNPVATDIADLDAVTDITIEGTAGITISDYQGFPAIGTQTIVSAYMVTQENQMNLIGRIPTQIIA